jgi:hypothetical protein
MIYLRKLIAEYPNDIERDRHLTRDLIVPRFYPWLVREYRMALSRGDEVAMKQAVADMRFLLPMHRIRARMVVGWMLPLLETVWVARLLDPVATAVRPILRRLLR